MKNKESKQCKVEFVDDLELDFKIRTTVVNVEEIEKKRFNRAKKKQKFRKQVEDYIYR